MAHGGHPGCGLMHSRAIQDQRPLAEFDGLAGQLFRFFGFLPPAKPIAAFMEFSHRPRGIVRHGARLQLAALLAAMFNSAAPAVAQLTQLTNCTELELRTAVANGGTVIFDCGNTITLTDTIVISTNVVLQRVGQPVTINGGGAARIFSVNPGVHLVISNLSLVNGMDAGASRTNGESADGGSGGALYNDGGTVTLVNCSFSDHRAVGGNGGDGLVELSGAGGNGGNGGAGAGGAVYNNGGTILATNCIFSGNVAEGGPAGDGADATSGGNGHDGGGGGAGGSGAGGAIYNAAGGMLHAYNCTFASNSVIGATGGIGGSGTGLGSSGANGTPGPAQGGAIANFEGNVTVQFSTFNGNASEGANGGNGRAGVGSAPGGPGDAGSVASGGGIHTSGGIFIATNCTIAVNSVVAGNGGDGGSGGPSGFGGDGGIGGAGGDANGGGLLNTGSGSTLMVNCTVTDNGALGGLGGGGGAAGTMIARGGSDGPPGADTGGGVANLSGTITLINTLLGYSSTGGNGAGIITDGGHNLSDDASVPLTGTGSRIVDDLLLGNLGDVDDDPPWTVPIDSASSPAVDAGDDVAAPSVDQRHRPRVGRSDIGAYELPQRPLLGINLQTNAVVLSWTNTFPGYFLESSPNMSPESWVVVVTNVTVSENLPYYATNGISGSGRFYRLNRQVPAVQGE